MFLISLQGHAMVSMFLTTPALTMKPHVWWGLVGGIQAMRAAPSGMDYCCYIKWACRNSFALTSSSAMEEHRSSP